MGKYDGNRAMEQLIEINRRKVEHEMSQVDGTYEELDDPAKLAIRVRDVLRRNPTPREGIEISEWTNSLSDEDQGVIRRAFVDTYRKHPVLAPLFAKPEGED